MVNVKVSYFIKHFLLKVLSNCWTFALLTARFFSFHRSLNLSTNLSQNSLSCRAYFLESLKNRWCTIISRFAKGDSFSSLMKAKCSGVISHCGPLLATSTKGLHLPFTLAKKRIYLDTQLKGKLTDLF